MSHRMGQATIDELTLPGVKNVDGVIVRTKDDLGKVLDCSGTIAPPSGKAGYAIGCFYRKSDGTMYRNTGSATSCTFTQIGALLGGTGYFAVAVNTNGVTPVTVFGAGGAPAVLTVTSVTTTALDTTAGNITLNNAASAVSTIAKSATAGALVGNGALANATLALGGACTVVSSSAGNATVIITFTTA